MKEADIEKIVQDHFDDLSRAFAEAFKESFEESIKEMFTPKAKAKAKPKGNGKKKPAPEPKDEAANVDCKAAALEVAKDLINAGRTDELKAYLSEAGVARVSELSDEVAAEMVTYFRGGS